MLQIHNSSQISRSSGTFTAFLNENIMHITDTAYMQKNAIGKKINIAIKIPIYKSTLIVNSTETLIYFEKKTDKSLIN